MNDAGTNGSGIVARVAAQVGGLQIDVNLETGLGPLALVGPNGSGKSSLLSLILGVLEIERGHIAVNRTVLVDTANRIDVPLEERRLGYVPQSYALFPHLSVRDNLDFALASSARPLERGARLQRIAAVLDELSIGALADRRPHGLSGGERQRVALARALCVEPRALLLDEPLAALDVHARRAVRAFLTRYLRELELPTIVVTHDAADARELGARIAVLEAGRLTQLGTWDELAAAPATKFVAEFVA
jgi:molybdate transport system ATP-binding protein